MAESRRDEHDRLQKRTDELKEEHAALDRDRVPFDQGDHDRHGEDLREHGEDLRRHRRRED